MKRGEGLKNNSVAKKKVFKIRLFGDFSIEYDGKKLETNKKRSRQLWTLLVYLIANRRTTISSERLVATLWEFEDIKNPAGALKNLVYRLRNILETIDPGENYDFITLKNGVYAWNSEIPCEIDTEIFEDSYQKASSLPEDDPEKIKAYEEAIDAYTGGFLSSIGYEEWVVSRAAYYSSVYIDCVLRVCSYYAEESKFEKLELLCSKAIEINPFEESLQLLKIEALLNSGKYKQALSHYEYVTALYYKELGIKPSDEFKELFKEIIKNIKGRDLDIFSLKDDLEEDEESDGGAFYCEYEIFRKMYLLEKRSAERTGQSVFLANLTIKNDSPASQSKEAQMEMLLESMMKCLRRGDVISRFSTRQYALMLPSLSLENGKMVVDRIKSTYKKISKDKGGDVKVELLPVG